MNFEAKLAGFVYRDGTNGEGWPDCVTVDNGGILLSEYDTRTYYPIDRKALLELERLIRRDMVDIDRLQLGIYGRSYLSWVAKVIRKALGEDN